MATTATPDERTPLELACLENDVCETVRLLRTPEGVAMASRRNATGRTPLHVAALRGGVEIVKLLLATPSVDVDARAADGNTALMDAVSEAGNSMHTLHLSDAPAMVDAFVAAGASLEVRNGEGNTALQLAFRPEAWDVENRVYDLLIAAGADPTDRTVGLGMISDWRGENLRFAAAMVAAGASLIDL